MMELYQRCHHWTVLQVVAIVICCRGKTLSAKIAQDCVGSQLSLKCPEMKVINITAVVLGDSDCYGTSCCIKDKDCTHNANANHRTEVQRTCDYKQDCTVKVLQERIPCGTFGVWQNNDFERITYTCIDDLQKSTTIKFSSPDSTQNSVRPEGNTPEKKTTNDDRASSTVGQNNEVTSQNVSGYDKQDGAQEVTLPVVMAIVCLLLLIAIVIVVVVMKRKRWPKVGDTVQMTDLNGSNRNETIYANEDQTMSQNHDNNPPIYSNHKIKKSRNKGNKSTKNHVEVQSNDVYSLVDKAGSRPTEDPNIYCNADSREPAYQVPRPRSNVYSLARDVEEPECAGSTADPSIVDNNVYCEAKTREPNKSANSSAQNVYDEACNVNEREYEAVKPDKSNSPTQKNQKKKMKKKKTKNPAHKTAPDSNTKVIKLSKNVATSEPSRKVASKDKVCAIDGYPNPIYEDMSPLVPESVYANAPVLSPNSSVVSRSIPTEGSATENPYCEMK